MLGSKSLHFLKAVWATFGCRLLELINQASVLFEKLSENPLGDQTLNQRPPFPPSKSNHERVRLNFYRWPLGFWVKEWLTIYYGTQSTGKNQPWNQTLWSWPLFLTFLIIRCFNLSCCVRSQFWKFQCSIDYQINIRSLSPTHFYRKSHNSITSPFYIPYIE